MMYISQNLKKLTVMTGFVLQGHIYYILVLLKYFNISIVRITYILMVCIAYFFNEY